MDKTVIQPIVIGIVMYGVLIVLAYAQRDLTVTQLILMVAAPLLIGIFSREIKRDRS